MSTELEELLRAGMERFTASAPIPTGLAERAARHRRRRRATITAAVAAGTAMAAAAVATVALAGGTGRTVAVAGGTGRMGGGTGVWMVIGSSPVVKPSTVRLGRATTAAELVAYAALAADALPPFHPKPHQWIYTQTLTADSSTGSGGFLFGPPDERVTTSSWIRADHLQTAGIVHGKLQVSPVIGSGKRYTPKQRKLFQQVAEGGGVGGWPDSSYPYLESLPTDPAKLEAIIAANTATESQLIGTGDTAIFNAITDLTENTVLPPKLYAALYGVLIRLPGVHFDATTDLAGRAGIGLYMVEEGYFKQEIVINPHSYTYMGYEDVAIKNHTDVATDGTRYIHNGQVLGWQALLASGIVDRPGQLP